MNKDLDERTRYPLFYIGQLFNRRRNHGDPATAAAAGGLHDDTGGMPPTRSTGAINYDRRKPASAAEAFVAHFTRALRITSLYRPPESITSYSCSQTSSVFRLNLHYHFLSYMYLVVRAIIPLTYAVSKVGSWFYTFHPLDTRARVNNELRLGFRCRKCEYKYL